MLIIFMGGILFFSCSKEDEEVPLANVEVETFDKGYLLIKIHADPSLSIDSIKYFNFTKGTSFDIPNSDLGYNLSANLAVLSKPLISGTKNDQVQCCIYLKTPINFAVAFEDLSQTVGGSFLDSMNTIFSGGNSVYCINGVY
ncbi:MAG: hypothetical protein JKY30_01350 [Flavobacteriales bacterium]|nr:hypothetical protein [Flavobacteriales bacterium]